VHCKALQTLQTYCDFPVKKLIEKARSDESSEINAFTLPPVFIGFVADNIAVCLQ